mmetsp:Transcript_35340/g.80161  ORF Transcript_35340/g.80161 Transcript_35340/m.80161 type:complete len:378 (-) Transcript_35340:6-1139(-)
MRGDRLELARGALKEEGQHSRAEPAHLDRRQASARGASRELILGHRVLEVRGAHPTSLAGGVTVDHWHHLATLLREGDGALDALIHPDEHRAEQTRRLAELGGCPRDESARERGVRRRTVCLKRVVHFVPILKVGGSLGGEAPQLHIEAGEQRRELLGDVYLAPDLVDRLAREFHQLVQFVGRGHLRAKEAWQPIHRVVPARLPRLHLDPHAEWVEDCKLVGRERDELRDDRHLHRGAIRRELPVAAAAVGVGNVARSALDECELSSLAGRRQHRVELPDLVVHCEHVLLGAVDASTWGEVERDRLRVEEHGFLLVREDGKEVVHQVEVVCEVVRPEAVLCLGVVARRHLLRVACHPLQDLLAARRQLDPTRPQVVE